MIDRFCSHCNQQQEATVWNVQLSVRLCPSCEQVVEDEDAASVTYLDDDGTVSR